MGHLHHALDVVFDSIFSPFSTLSPLWGMLWISLLTAVLALLVYRYLSSQQALRSVKDRLRAHILEIQLFQHDARLVSGAIRSLLAANFVYLRLSLKPFLFMVVPVVLVLIQMEARFGYRPLLLNESVTVRTLWTSPTPLDIPDRQATLIPREGIEIESPPLRIQNHREIDWKVRTTRSGETTLSLLVGDQTVSFPIFVSGDILPVTPRVLARDSWDILLHPGARILAAGNALESLTISYPRRDFDFFGHRIHWALVFFVLTLVAGYALKGVFRVQF